MSGFAVERRGILVAGIAALLVDGVPAAESKAEVKKKGEVDARDTGAVEDLMREHGVLRRCFLAYRECAGRLRIDPASVDASALNDTARLFRNFGEDYHEKKLEEVHIFPKIKRQLSGADASVDTLIAQHQRGREVTNYILSVTAGAKISASDSEPLARAFDAFEAMYANHTAREDTLVFPAWKKALSPAEIAEMGDLFEDIERAEFGTDGFDEAVRRIADIEDRLGLTSLAQFTAPTPPRSQP
jgi:hemerythrin-like domain-containing protein